MNSKYFFLVMLIVNVISSGIAQDINKSNKRKESIFNRYKISASFIYGWGRENMDIAETTENTVVKISAGGGYGGEICFGYIIVPSFEVNLGLILQSSVYEEEKDRVVEDLKANFNRYILSCTPKMNIPITKKMKFKFGGGIDYYYSGKLDIDFSGIEHDIYKYNNITGLHITSEIEIFAPELGKKTFVVIGIKYYHVEYDLNSCSSNGIPVPINALPVEVNRKVNKLNGSGFDMMIGFSFYF